MNKIQKNYRKQMKEIENQLLEEEKQGKGLFTNRHYKYRFYGDGHSPYSKWKKALIIIAIVLAVLFLTNPGKQDFNDWVMSEFFYQQDIGGEIDEEMLAFIGNLAVDNIVERKNYIFFSIYKPVFENDKNSKILGICRNFIKLY